MPPCTASPVVVLFVFGLLVRELLPCRREFPQLAPNHILCDGYVVVNFPIVHLEFESNKVGQYRGSTGLRLYWRYSFTGLRSYDWEWDNVRAFPDGSRA